MLHLRGSEAPEPRAQQRYAEVPESQRITPQPGPQTAFMNCDADIVLFGGAAGSGKSYALLLEAMRYPARVAGFDSVMFRRSTVDLRRPGGLWSETMKLFPHAGGVPITHRLEWVWPGRGSVKLSHLEYDQTCLEWHGSQIGCLCFDELTTFTKYQFTYLASRNRSTTAIRPYIRASCNADAGSWVAELIAWWIDQETGYPIMERGGVVRYFVRDRDDSLKWFDSKREAMAAFGIPAEAVKSLTFIPAKLHDNPALMRNDPGYLGNLMNLPQVERERLLNGNWRITPSAGLFFNRNWVQVVDIPVKTVIVARGWDLAATKETVDNDPDYTTCTKIGRCMDGRYIVLDHRWLRGSPAEVERMIRNVASQDGFGCTISIPQDPGQAGKSQVATLATMMAGYPLEFSLETGDKITRFSPFSAQAEVGNVLVLRGEWNERWFQQLEGFPDAVHDDDADSTARAFRGVTAGPLAQWLRM